MCIGRLKFELWLYYPSTAWPGHRAVRLSKEVHIYVHINVYLSPAWLIEHNQEGTK